MSKLVTADMLEAFQNVMNEFKVNKWFAMLMVFAAVVIISLTVIIWALCYNKGMTTRLFFSISVAVFVYRGYHILV